MPAFQLRLLSSLAQLACTETAREVKSFSSDAAAPSDKLPRSPKRVIFTSPARRSSLMRLAPEIAVW